MTAYKRKLLNKRIIGSPDNAESGISRRRLLISGGALLVALGLGYVAYEGFNKLDSLLSEEETNVLKTRADLYLHNKGEPVKFNVPRTYVGFRGDVFELITARAKAGDGPLALIHRVNEQYNQGAPIKGDLAYRALDLFNIILQNKQQLDEVVNNEIKSFRFKVEPTPLIKSGSIYEVPAYTGYGSLKDIPRNKID